MTEIIRDFHLHTHHSDGVLSPGELVERAHAYGVRELAVTDHNAVAGSRRGTGGEGRGFFS